MDDSAPPTTAETPGKEVERAFSRLSVVVSTVTAVATLIITIASDAVSAPWLLSGATVTSGICLTILFFSFGKANDSQLRRFFKLANVVCAVVLGMGWLFVYRDDVWFSKSLSVLFSGPVIMVDQSVAHSLVSSKSGSVSKDQRLMSVLDKIVQEPHHTVVQRASDSTSPHVLLEVTGVEMPSRSSLILAVPESDTPPKLSESVARGLDTIGSFVRIAAGDDRFLASAFDSGPLRISIACSPQEMSELLMMGYHAIMGVKLARVSGAGARERFLRLHEFRDLVTPEQLRGIPWLPDALLFAAHWALVAGDASNAAMFIDDGRRLLPDDARLRVAAAYLKFRGGNHDVAAQMLKGEHLDGGDPTLSETLRALIDLKAGDIFSALGHLETAAASDTLDTPAAIFVAHAMVALLAAEMDASPEERGSRILEHTAAAERAIPGVPLIALLSGFGSDLVGNSMPAEEAFARARRLSKTAAEVEACDYWEAWGLAQSSVGLAKAIQMLDELEHKGAASPRLLGLLAELNALDLYNSSDPSREVETNSVRRAFEVA